MVAGQDSYMIIFEIFLLIILLSGYRIPIIKVMFVNSYKRLQDSKKFENDKRLLNVRDGSLFQS